MLYVWQTLQTGKQQYHSHKPYRHR